MQIKHGWSGEYETNRWGKFDVELDETDLRRILFAEGALIDDVAKIQPRHAFALLQAEAETLLLLKMISAYSYPVTEGTARIKELAALKKDVLTKIESYVEPTDG